MPRRGPYGWQYERRRQAILRPGVECHLCGAPASELDHVPPLAVHRHVEGSGCCRVLPACGDCQRKQGAELGFAGHWTPPQPEPEPEPELAPSPGPSSAVWNACPWLADLRAVPAEGHWPRFMSGPHPAAVGSYGPAAIGWLTDAGLGLRWWQRLVLCRQLEHDSDGVLVWLSAMITTSRQSGKSTWLRASSTWRLHQSPLFAEPQMILHTGKDLPVCKEVQLPAMAWAQERGYACRKQNGNEEITEPLSGSRWIIRGKGSVYGYPGSMVLVDEAWGVPPDVVEDGLEPTMLERAAPQLVLASTAHRRATALFTGRRANVLDELGDPGSTLLVEWSVPRATDLADRAGWRASSPHWSPGRARLLEARLARVEAGQSLDPDEDDPAESFRAQYLNIWPIRTGPSTGDPLLADGAWAALEFSGTAPGGPVFVAVEDNYGLGAAVAAVARVDDDRFEIDGWCCETWQRALDDALALLDARPGSRLIVGPTIATRVPDLRPRPARAGSTETRTGLSLVRELVRGRRLVHDDTPDLDRQLDGARVRHVAGGGLALISSRRADVLRATAWALREAQHRPARPAIH